MADKKEVLNVDKEIDAWADIAIERFQKVLKQKKIGVTGNLYRSFEKEVQKSGGNVQAVFIRFAMYGRFRDMGVGRGMKAHERETNRWNLIANKAYGADVEYSRRRPKRWFNKPKMAQIYRLREILAESVGHAMVANLQEGFQGDQTQYRVNV